MEYIKDTDYSYIMNKYHDISKPYDFMDRFGYRNDAFYPKDTGMEPDAILQGVLQEDQKWANEPHVIRKARAVQYILENTRISCDSRDRFPAINMNDQPFYNTLLIKWYQEVFDEKIPEVGKKMIQFIEEGIATLWPDFSHNIPVFEQLFGLGITGTMENSERVRREKAEKGPLTREEEAFYEGISIIYRAVSAFTERLARQARETPGSERMAQALENIAQNPPVTFYETLLLYYIFFIISEHIEGTQVRSLSNFDRIYYPYYKRDLENGVSEAEIRTDLAYFLLQFRSIDDYWNQPVCLGGCKEDGETEINELSYLFLDVYDKMGIHNPKIQIKVAESTPKVFLMKALDMIRRGHSSIVFLSDSMIRASLLRAGATPERARLANVTGCYGYCAHESIFAEMNYVNLMKPLEYTLHQGCDGVTGKFVALKSPPAEDFDTFEAFYEEYKKQLRHLIDEACEIVNAYDEHLADINPQPLFSATYPSCLESARDALAGGVVSTTSIMCFGFLADLVDSLTAIKKYVYDKKELTLAKLRDILDRNYEGHELFRKKLLMDRDKFGNNREQPDRFAVEIAELLTSYLGGRPNAARRRGKWTVSFHVARMSYEQGAKTAASPNGRLFGEELSKNISASMGQNREGATAAILSATKIDATSFTGNSTLDMGLLPSAVKGEEGLEAMYALLWTYIRRGGGELHMNVFDAKTLRDAQAHPEKYEDLQIRVCGWNVLFNLINKVEQDGFIRQAEALV